MEHAVPPESLILTVEQLDEVAAHYASVDSFAFDVETMGPERGNPRRGHVTWLVLATYGRTDVIPMGHPHGELISERPAPLKTGLAKLARGKTYEELRPSDLSKIAVERTWTAAPLQLPRSRVFSALNPVFAGPAVKVGHNVKFDAHAVTQHSYDPPAPPYFDTHVAAWLLDVSQKGNLTLDDCARRFLNFDMVKGVGKEIEAHAFSEVAKYSFLDGRYTWLLYLELLKIYGKSDSGTRNLLDMEMAVLEPSFEMEHTGVRVDTDAMKVLDHDLYTGIAAAQMMCEHHAGRAFNLNSNVDKQEVLFTPKALGGQGLKPKVLTKGGKEKQNAGIDPVIGDYATDHDTLAAFAGNKLVDEMLTYAQLTKLRGTYVTPYLGGEVTKTTGGKAKTVIVLSRLDRGRIYAQFVQTGAESGRFSSRNPNLQNIPSRSLEGKKLRTVFVADEGHTLVVADYSQIEPRIIASLSGDSTMIATYRDGGDIYQAVADRLGVTRPVGKELILAMSYGVGAAKIATRTGLTLTEARDLLDYFAAHFRAIPVHKGKVIAAARRDGYAATIWGRRRPLPQLKWKDPEARSGAERQAYNHTIQGSAADMMKMALVNVYDALHAEQPQAKLLMTVHDEVVITAPESVAADVMVLVKTEMESVGSKLAVPLVADVGSGPRWSDAK